MDWVNDDLYILFGNEQLHSELPVHVAIYDITTGGDYRTILTSTQECNHFYYLVVDPFAEQVQLYNVYQTNIFLV